MGKKSKTVSLKEHLECVREADHRFDAERDRRNCEVSQEREKALKIKEEADKIALQLAREIQTYKDEKANELRAQIESERGRYPTRDELSSVVKELKTEIAPLITYVTSQQGKSSGYGTSWAILASAITLAGTIAGLVVIFNR